MKGKGALITKVKGAVITKGKGAPVRRKRALIWGIVRECCSQLAHETPDYILFLFSSHTFYGILSP